MPKLKALSGVDLLKIFGKFGFLPVGQEGSHVKLRRQLLTGQRQTLTIPLHAELARGTLKAIFNQALRYTRRKPCLPISIRTLILGARTDWPRYAVSFRPTAVLRKLSTIPRHFRITSSVKFSNRARINSPGHNRSDESM